jgi:hypothetical protein
VRTGSDFGHVVVVGQALPAGDNHVQVLVGYYGHEGATARRLSVEVRLSGLSHIVKGSRVGIQVMRIPDIGVEIVNKLPVVHAGTADILDDELSIDLTSLDLHDVYAIRVEES